METTLSLYANRWKALALLCVAQFMVIMDTSIIGVALPAIKTDLGYTDSGLQWIFNAYVIVFGGVLLMGGKMADLFGARKVFNVGFLILVIGSLLAGFSSSEIMLNVSRGIQGFGSALIAPSALTLLMTMFSDPKEIGKALGFWGASAAAGGSAGVFLGGVITEWISWEWVFFINVPIGLIVLLFSNSYLLKGQVHKGSLNVLSSIVLTLTMVLFVYGIILFNDNFSKGIVFVGIAVLLVILFVVMQKKQSQPLLPLAIFSNRFVRLGNLATIFLAAAWIPLWFFLNLYLQSVLSLNAFNSGLALLPMTILIMLLMVVFMEKSIHRFGLKFNLLIGFFLLTLALIMFSFVGVNGTFLSDVLIPSLIAATGMSFAYIPSTIVSMMGVKPEETGLSSGIVNTSYQIGSAVGLAIMVAISNFVNASAIQNGKSVLDAINSGFQFAFFISAIIAALGFVMMLFFLRIPKSN